VDANGIEGNQNHIKLVPSYGRRKRVQNRTFTGETGAEKGFTRNPALMTRASQRASRALASAATTPRLGHAGGRIKPGPGVNERNRKIKNGNNPETRTPYTAAAASCPASTQERRTAANIHEAQKQRAKIRQALCAQKPSAAQLPKE
jgi:hypothetical protein